MSGDEGTFDEAWYAALRATYTTDNDLVLDCNDASTPDDLCAALLTGALFGDLPPLTDDDIPPVRSEEPGHISVLRLRAYALRPQTEKFNRFEQAHLAVCASCRRNRDRMIEDLWHPNDEMLESYRHGRLMLQDLETVFAHVNEYGCEHCNARLAHLKGFATAPFETLASLAKSAGTRLQAGLLAGAGPESAEVSEKLNVQSGAFALDAQATVRGNSIHLLIESVDTQLASGQVLLLGIRNSAGQEIARAYTAIHAGVNGRRIGRTALFNTEYDAVVPLAATTLSARNADEISVPETDSELIGQCFAWAKQYDHEASQVWQDWLKRQPLAIRATAYRVANHIET